MANYRLSRAENQAMSAAWADWITSMGEWHLFGGLTYDPGRRRTDERTRLPIAPGADVAKHHVLSWLGSAPKTLGRPIDAAVVALEYHKNGWPHFHPMLRVAGGLQGDELRLLGGAWFRSHGFAKLEQPRDVADTAAYAAKYLAKDINRGDIIFWPTRGPLDRHQPAL